MSQSVAAYWVHVCLFVWQGRSSKIQYYYPMHQSGLWRNDGLVPWAQRVIWGYLLCNTLIRPIRASLPGFTCLRLRHPVPNNRLYARIYKTGWRNGWWTNASRQDSYQLPWHEHLLYTWTCWVEKWSASISDSSAQTFITNSWPSHISCIILSTKMFSSRTLCWENRQDLCIAFVINRWSSAQDVYCILYSCNRTLQNRTTFWSYKS